MGKQFFVMINPMECSVAKKEVWFLFGRFRVHVIELRLAENQGVRLVFQSCLLYHAGAGVYPFNLSLGKFFGKKGCEVTGPTTQVQYPSRRLVQSQSGSLEEVQAWPQPVQREGIFSNRLNEISIPHAHGFLARPDKTEGLQQEPEGHGQNHPPNHGAMYNNHVIS